MTKQLNLIITLAFSMSKPLLAPIAIPAGEEQRYVKYQDERSGKTLSIGAAQDGLLENTAQLLKLGSDVHISDQKKHTALSYACFSYKAAAIINNKSQRVSIFEAIIKHLILFGGAFPVFKTLVIKNFERLFDLQSLLKQREWLHRIAAGTAYYPGSHISANNLYEAAETIVPRQKDQSNINYLMQLTDQLEAKWMEFKTKSCDAFLKSANPHSTDLWMFDDKIPLYTSFDTWTTDY